MEQKKVLRGPFKNEFENPFYFAFRIALIEKERERNRRDRIERKKDNRIGSAIENVKKLLLSNYTTKLAHFIDTLS